MLDFLNLPNPFGVYQNIETPKVTLDLPLMDNPLDISDWAYKTTENGTPIVKSNIEGPKMIIDNTEEVNPTTETVSSNSDFTSVESGSYAQNHKGYLKQLLSDTIDKLSKEDPNIAKIKGYLMDTAALESGFKLTSSVSPKIGSASGWFGFIDSTKKSILEQLGISATREQFNNSPDILVKAAARLYYNHLNTAKKNGILDAALKKGYSLDDVIHAMWLNPTWAKNFFLKGEAGGKDAFGTSVLSYLNKIHGRRTKKK